MAHHLLIETSGRGGSVGLASEQSIHSIALDESRRHARDLADSVRQLLEREAIAPRDVASVIVSIGPGSYTGLRVGLASAKAFAFATGCPLVAVPTFNAFAQMLPADVEEVQIVADALQGLVYVQRYLKKNAVDELRIDPMKSLSFSPPSEGGEKKKTNTSVFAGPGVKLFNAPNAILIERPSIEGLWLASRSITPLTRAEMFAVEPLYLRGSSAEELRKAKSQ